MVLSIEINDNIVAKNIIGANNVNIKTIEDIYNINLEFNGNKFITDSNDTIICSKLERIINLLKCVALEDISISPRDVMYINNVINNDLDDEYIEFINNRKSFVNTYNNKPIYAKTLKQNEYIKCMEKNDLVFSIGSAGTGKTYLAVCYAVKELKKGNVDKIILSRPAVEAGESLGFLPGDLKEKVDPYLKPLYDSLYDMLGFEGANNLINKQVIEIAPLAYMRGRTLENAFVILDEAQNSTIGQLKMFLTRLGFNSKMIVTGDISQIDLPKTKKSGLKIATEILKGIPSIGIIKFENYDVVRHPLVSKIIEKFENIDE